MYKLAIISPLLLLLFPRINRFQYPTGFTLPVDNLSPDCSAALISDIDCPRQVKSFVVEDYFPAATLKQACTSGCSAALAGYESSIAGACSSETYNLTSHGHVPVAFIPQTLFYSYNKYCILDAGRWCNSVAAQAARIGNTTTVDDCDNCLIKQLQFQAGSPINEGAGLHNQYSSLTSSCSKNGFPPTSSTPPFFQKVYDFNSTKIFMRDMS